MVKFFTDVHIAREAAQQLRRRGIDIVHCGDVGMADEEDIDLFKYAIQDGRVMVSCDEDFERLHTRWQATSQEHTGILYFRMKDQCQSIGLIVREIIFLHEAADYETDLYNQIWRAQG